MICGRDAGAGQSGPAEKLVKLLTVRDCTRRLGDDRADGTEAHEADLEFVLDCAVFQCFQGGVSEMVPDGDASPAQAQTQSLRVGLGFHCALRSVTWPPESTTQHPQWSADGTALQLPSLPACVCVLMTSFAQLAQQQPSVRRAGKPPSKLRKQGNDAKSKSKGFRCRSVQVQSASPRPCDQAYGHQDSMSRSSAGWWSAHDDFPAQIYPETVTMD